MKNMRDIERLVKRLCAPADAETRHRILGDAMEAIEQLGRRGHTHGTMAVLLKQLGSYRMVKIAGVAALITVTVMLAQYLLFLFQLRLEYPYFF